MQSSSVLVIAVALIASASLFAGVIPSFVLSAAVVQGNVSAAVLMSCNYTAVTNSQLVQNMTCNGTAVRIYADNVTLNCLGYTIKGNGTGYGIFVNSSNTRIVNCAVQNFSSSIYADPNNTIIDNNTLQGSEYGLIVTDSFNITIRNNTIQNNSISGILINNTNSSNIYNNTFTGNYLGLNITNSTNNTIWYNSFRSSQLAHANAPSGNYFNISVSGISRGNSWSDLSSLAIYDSNSDNYGDTGSAYPYSLATGGFVLGAVQDWGPYPTSSQPSAPPEQPTPPPSGGAAGGLPSCRTNWTCTDWSECTSEGLQTRSCSDANKCAAKLAERKVDRIVSTAVPDTNKSCVYIPTCHDNIKNQGESDIDCSGQCAQCKLGSSCALDSDCESAFCHNNICTQPTCSDKIKNQGEEEIDCGGPCEACELPYIIIDTPGGRFYLPRDGNMMILIISLIILVLVFGYIVYRYRKKSHRKFSQKSTKSR